MPHYDTETISPGSSFFLSFQASSCNGYTDLSNYVISSQIKNNYSTSGLLSFNSSVILPASGICSISLTPTQTSGLSPGVYVYSVNAYNSGTLDSISLLEGHLSVGPFPAY